MPTLYEPLPEWLQDSLTEQVELELLRLHISRTMSGYHYAAYGVAQVIQSPEIINGLTKELYPEIAKQFQVRPANVERSIRVAIRACWERGGREALDEMAGIHLTKRPQTPHSLQLSLITYGQGLDNSFPGGGLPLPPGFFILTYYRQYINRLY